MRPLRPAREISRLMTEEGDVAVETLFLIPAYNAAATLGGVLDQLRFQIAQNGLAEKTEILVVDDGSTDETPRVLATKGVRVERHSENRGKGAALRTGLRWAEARGISQVVSLDADGQHPSEEAVKLCLHPAARDVFLIGTRDLREANAPRPNQLSNAFSNQALSFFAGRKLLDTQSGLRRYPVQETLSLNSKAEGFAFEADVLLRAARAGQRIVHVPIRVLYPPSRTSRFRSVADPTRIVFSVLKTTFTTPFRGTARGRGLLFAGAPLFVLVTPAEQPPASMEVLLKACSEAAAPRVCQIAPTAELAEAEVAWQSDLGSAQVRFRNGSRPQESRTISFSGSDPAIERFRAVGYAVGTWGTAAQPPETQTPTRPPDAPPSESPPPSSPSSAPPSPPADRPPAPPLPKEKPRTITPGPATRVPSNSRKQQSNWIIDLGGEVGTSYDNEARVGPMLGLVGQRLIGPIDLGVRGSFLFVPAWTTGGTEFSGHFWTMGMSLGVSAVEGKWGLSGEIGPFLEEMSLGGPSLMNSSRVQGGGRGSLILRRTLASHLQLLAGVEVGLRTGTTTVNIDGEPALALPPLFANLHLGISIPLGAEKPAR
jgi:hypothetical protein